MGRIVEFVKMHKTIFIGCLCGLLCAGCVFAYTSGVQKSAQRAQSEALAEYGGSQIEVCVARNNITAGSVISANDLETKMWIASLLPENAITNKDDAIGKTAGSLILSGEVISSSRLGVEHSAVNVPDGLVALSLPLREVQAVGGALTARMKVDIYAVSSNGATLIDSSVEVLEVSSYGQSSSSSSNTWITVAVEPDKVEELVAAAQNLDIYASLPADDVLDDRAEAEASVAKKKEEAASISSFDDDESNLDDVLDLDGDEDSELESGSVTSVTAPSIKEVE